jgi:peptidyl-prolyl cis-trans isomerase A (cyclophilin A)
MPMTVANFVGLAEGTIKNDEKAAGVPYYDGLKFHRIIPGFMIQGGCPAGNGSGDPGYSFNDELDSETEIAKKGYVRGALAMANRGPNTNGSQFFIMHQNYGLPYAYVLFGSVVKGIDVVDSIVASPRNGGDLPNVDQTIKHITILRKGKEAEAFDAAKVFEFEKANGAAKAEAKIKAKIEKFGKVDTRPSGLRVIVENPGTGASSKPGDLVSIHCVGSLLSDGTKFWSSYDTGQPLTQPIGMNPPKLIPGMEEGIMMLKQGGKAKLIIPPNLGYGERGSPPAIPANAWLVFDIEVVKIEAK